MPAPVLRHDPSGIAPESFLGLDAPGAGRLDAKWPNPEFKEPRGSSLAAGATVGRDGKRFDLTARSEGEAAAIRLTRGSPRSGINRVNGVCDVLSAPNLALAVALVTVGADRGRPAVGMAGFRAQWVVRWESVHGVFLPGVAETDAMKDDRNDM